jgi:hypothetical protein
MENKFTHRVRRITLVALACLLLLGSGRAAYAQRYSFLASAADYCGMGGIRISGFEQNHPNWATYGPHINITGPYAYLAYSWELRDRDGVIASGSYDSRTNTSTGGTWSTGANFQVSRYPVGTVNDMSFAAWGSFYTNSGYGGPCSGSFFASTYTTMSSGGYFRYQ